MKNMRNRKIISAFIASVLLLTMVASAGCGGTEATSSVSPNSSESSESTAVSTNASSGETVGTTIIGTENLETTSSQSITTTGIKKTDQQTTTTVNHSVSETSLTWDQVLGKMPASLKGSTVTVYSWNEDKAITGGEKAIADFEKATGINVQWGTGSYENYATEIAALIAAKKAPDIIRLKGIDVSIIGMMQPISVSEYDFNDTAWSDIVTKTYTVKNKVYAVALQDSLIQMPQVMFYNKDLISKYDLDDPYALWKKGNWTWKTFEELAEIYMDESGETPWASNNFQDYCDMLGAGFVSFDGKQFVSNMSDKRLVTGWQKMAGYLESGFASSNLWDMDSFTAGRTLFFSASIIGARSSHFYFQDMKAKGSLGAVPYPAIDGQSTYYQHFRELEAYGIPQGARNPKAVPYFLRYFLDANNYDENSFFTDRTILDVYKACIAQPVYYINNDMYVLTQDTGITSDSLINQLKSTKPAQIATTLAAQQSAVELAVKSANAQLAHLGN